MTLASQPTPSPPRRALFLINRNARTGAEAYEPVATALTAAGFTLIEPREAGQTLSDAIVRHKDEVDLVIIGGGDGSLNLATAGLMETGLPLGIIPLGTANDLARTLEIPKDINQACEIIADGMARPIDVGDANGKFFFNVASLGLSVEITRQLDPDFKKRWGVLAYLWTGIVVALRARLFHAEIRTATESVQVKTLQIAVGNGVFHGGGMMVSDRATIDDGQLDLYSLEARHWWQLLWLAPYFLNGRQGSTRWVRMLHGQEFEVIPKRNRPVNTDGEITTRTPVKFKIWPKAVTVMVAKAASS